MQKRHSINSELIASSWELSLLACFEQAKQYMAQKTASLD